MFGGGHCHVPNIWGVPWAVVCPQDWGLSSVLWRCWAGSPGVSPLGVPRGLWHVPAWWGAAVRGPDMLGRTLPFPGVC